MNDNIDLKSLWNLRKNEAPKIEEIIEKAKKYKNKQLRTLIFANITLILTSVFVSFIWIKYEPKMLTTKIGIVLTILAMAIYLLVYNKNISFLKNVDLQLDSQKYLKQLIVYKEKQHFLQQKMLALYFILLTLGLGLYLVEYVMQMKPLLGIIFYFLTFLWIAFVWFYLRPKQILKQNRELNNLIEHLKNVQLS